MHFWTIDARIKTYLVFPFFHDFGKEGRIGKNFLLAKHNKINDIETIIRKTIITFLVSKIYVFLKMNVLLRKKIPLL